MEYSYSPSPIDAVSITHRPTLRSSTMLQEAFAAGEQEVVSLKASKLLQILRGWRAQSRRQAAHASRRSTARSTLCSRLALVPLSCVRVHLHSDDENEDDESFAGNSRRLRTPSTSTRQGPARALSCPKLISSPLRACTPFSNMHFDEQMRNEELECLHASNEEITDRMKSKGSSPLKLVGKQPCTPKGYLALYVGEERKRFLVKAGLVNHPLFGVLLEKAKEEFGFEQKGPLNIPCEIGFFQHIMLLVESNDPFYRNADHSTILLHFNNNMATTVTV